MIWGSILSVGLGSLGVSDTPMICAELKSVYTCMHSQKGGNND
jgi:hypothetical protein